MRVPRHRANRLSSGRSTNRVPPPLTPDAQRPVRETFPAPPRAPEFVPAKQTTTFASVAAAAPPTLDQVIRYTLFNKAPIANPVQLSVNSQTRVVTVNSVQAIRMVGRHLFRDKAPVNGTVDITQSGAYTFTPNTELADNGGTDQFRVTIADANVYRLAGVLRNDPGDAAPLAQSLGLSGPDSTTVTVNVSIGSTG